VQINFHFATDHYILLLFQVKLSDLATCSPASSILLDVSEQKKTEKRNPASDMPLQISASNSSDEPPLTSDQVSAETSHHFTKIRRVSVSFDSKHVFLDVAADVDSILFNQATHTNILVGDSCEGRSVMSMVSPSPSGTDHNLRFAPQWTAPEMLRTPLGVCSRHFVNTLCVCLFASHFLKSCFCQEHPVCLPIFTGAGSSCQTQHTHVTFCSLGVVFWEIFHQAEPFADQPNVNSDPRYRFSFTWSVSINTALSLTCYSVLTQQLESRQITLKVDKFNCVSNACAHVADTL
jgi:hypothetical protein